jgi:RND superfamily putative drug exporter
VPTTFRGDHRPDLTREHDVSATVLAPSPPASPSAPPPPRRGAVVGVARWSARHRWIAVVAWLAFVVAAVVAGGAVGTNQMTVQDQATGASGPADIALDGADFGELPTENVLVQAPDGGPVDPVDPGITALATELAALPGTAEVQGPLPSADGTSVLFQVALAEGGGTDEEKETAAAEASAGIAQVVAAQAAANPDLRIGQAGDVTLAQAVDQIYEDDLRNAEIMSVPVSLAILVVAFGALIAAGVPVLLALSSVAAAMGLSALASHLIPSSDPTASVILLVGMAVGVDYSLFYVRREREERLAGRNTRDAIEVAAATSGRAVVVSGLTVVVAMAGMFLAGEATFASLAVGTILVVSVAVAGSVTVLPALLSILGRWVDRPRIPLLWRLQSRDGQSRFWPAVLRPVLARPAVALGIGVAVLGGVALPAIGMNLANPGIDDLPRNQPAFGTYDRIVAAYPSEGMGHTVAVWSTDGTPLDRTALDTAVADLGQATATDPDFATAQTAPVAEYDAHGDVARIEVAVTGGGESDQAVSSLETLREDVLPATIGEVPGTETAVTGMTAWDQDFRQLLADRMPIVIGFVLLLTIVVLVMAFRSLTVALTAAALNLLSVGAAYGLLVLVFQNQWAEGLLGFESNGAVVAWLPLFLFVILFGLSMDYHVFVVSRIREAAQAGMPTKDAVAHGITRSAGVVTSAAAVMVAVFAIFATLSPLDFKQLGVGLAAAILIDATIVRAVLLPSAMALLGENNWWMPRWMNKLPALGH